MNLLLAMAARPGFGADDSMVALTDLSFDLSLVELVLPLVVGGRVVLAGREVSAEPSAIMNLIRSSEATVMQATPTTWLTLLGAGWSGAPELRIWCGGESMARELADRLLTRGATVWNLYGPTETTVWSSAWQVEADGSIMVGTPLDNTTTHVLDAEQQPLPVGVAGEVYIGGAGVADGYQNRAELTAHCFVADPFVSGAAARMYRTGDLGVRTPEGSFELLGRADDQIKVRGHRIEPGEIEEALRSIEGVGDAAVIAGSDQRLVAFVVDAGANEPAELRRALSKTLPGYMIPQVFERIDELPLTSTDKVDRRALRDRPLTPMAVEYAPPNPGLESEMAELWKEFLDVPRVGRHDDFFDLGGDSLVALRLAIEVERLTGRPFPIHALIESPTLGEIAGVVETAPATRPDHTSLVPVRRSGREQPFFYVTAFLVTPLGLTNVASHVGDRPFYALQPQGLDHDLPAETSIEEMASHYIDEMRTVQAKGPYALGGHCAGSWVALEIAHQLEQAGEVVNALVVVDAAPPGGGATSAIERARRLLRRLRYYVRTGRLRDALAWQARLMVDLRISPSAAGVTVRRIALVRRAHAMAHRHYRGARVDAGAVIILSEQSALTEHMNWRERWATFVRGKVTLEVVSGAHAALTDPIPARDLGSILENLIPRRAGDGLAGR